MQINYRYKELQYMHKLTMLILNKGSGYLSFLSSLISYFPSQKHTFEFNTKGTSTSLRTHKNWNNNMLIHLSTPLNFTYVFSSLTGKKSWAGFFQENAAALTRV